MVLQNFLPNMFLFYHGLHHQSGRGPLHCDQEDRHNIVKVGGEHTVFLCKHIILWSGHVGDYEK